MATTTNAAIESLSLRNRASASWVGERPSTAWTLSPGPPGTADVWWVSSSLAGMLIVTSVPQC